MKIAVFICDVGNGHLSRISAVLKQLIKVLDITAISCYCGRNINRAKSELGFLDMSVGEIHFFQYGSYINWHPDKSGAPDYQRIIESLHDINTKRLIDNLKILNPTLKDVDFVLNDGVPFALKIASELNVKIYNTFHFTWSWFFSKCYPLNLICPEIDELFKYECLPAVNFTMPFTPSEITGVLNNKVKIDFILDKDFMPSNTKYHGSNILIVDSGAGHTGEIISQIVEQLVFRQPLAYEIHVIGSGDYRRQTGVIYHSNLNSMVFRKLLIDANLVIARPGFNLLTELLYLNKKCIFYFEKGNPEMVDTYYQFRDHKRFQFLPAEIKNLDYILSLVEHVDYMDSRDQYSFDGARQVADYIAHYC